MRAIHRAILQREPGFETVRSRQRPRGAWPSLKIGLKPRWRLGRLEHAGDGRAWSSSRASAPTRSLDAMRIMMVTTETETDAGDEGPSAGADEYLMKPFTKEALFAKLNMLDAFPDGGI